MKRISLIVVTVALLGAGGTAQAHQQRLTLRQARAAITRTDRADRPLRVAISSCQRRSRTVVRCRVVEYVFSDWFVNEQRIAMAITSLDTVRLRHRHAVASSSVTWFSNG